MQNCHPQCRNFSFCIILFLPPSTVITVHFTNLIFPKYFFHHINRLLPTGYRFQFLISHTFQWLISTNFSCWLYTDFNCALLFCSVLFVFSLRFKIGKVSTSTMNATSTPSTLTPGFTDLTLCKLQSSF